MALYVIIHSSTRMIYGLTNTDQNPLGPNVERVEVDPAFTLPSFGAAKVLNPDNATYRDPTGPEKTTYRTETYPVFAHLLALRDTIQDLNDDGGIPNKVKAFVLALREIFPISSFRLPREEA